MNSANTLDWATAVNPFISQWQECLSRMAAYPKVLQAAQRVQEVAFLNGLVPDHPSQVDAAVGFDQAGVVALEERDLFRAEC